jgi:hypothetical protein
MRNFSRSPGRVFIPFVTLVAGSVGALGCGGSPPTNSFQSADPLESSAKTVNLVVPKPIPGGDYFPAQFFHRDGIIHQFYPVPPPLGDGVWAEPNGMTDFNGFVAQIFQGGTAVDSAGKEYVVDIDNRVYVGEYIGVDGKPALGAFCEI